MSQHQPTVAERVKYAGDAVLAAYKDDARTVIKALIEFGDHLEYCNSRRGPNRLCDCGRLEAVTDGWALVLRSERAAVAPSEGRSR